MKTIVLIMALISAFSVYASNECLNLSGEYMFGGFNNADCEEPSDLRFIAPIPLGSIIKQNSTIIIRQKSCSDLEISYADDRFLNTKNVKEKHSLDMLGTETKNGKISYSKTKSSSICMMGGCLSSLDKMSWSLGLDENSNLNVKFKQSSIGLYNIIIPIVKSSKTNCTLIRIK